jgi:DNA-binding transcriptional LysR family regulator
MNEIDLRRFDLNLLVVLDVLMIERSVTRAAERLGRTQSAVSHALARLREQLGDPLLLKGGRRMQPTPFALDFIEQARPILHSMRRVLAPRRAFDPRTSRRVFRVAAPDFAVSLFTTLLTRLRDEAPGVALEWTGLRDPMLLQLVDGQLDAAIAPAQLRLPDGITSEPVGARTWRCFARSGHPAFRKWGATAWSRWPHIVVRVGDNRTPVNAAATAARLDRRIVAWVPNFSAIAPVLSDTDLLATLPSIAMLDAARQYRIDSRHGPFALAPLPHALLWNAGRARDPEVAWLRERLRPLVQATFANRPLGVTRLKSSQQPVK